ncbi:MAG: hybrid sensor histidine kinase/response regulator [Desertifilum sp. SIO1I2]|nr:hybrid sensor histidine kinase/response regulator [Desertifilum sp. SIO1I2]
MNIIPLKTFMTQVPTCIQNTPLNAAIERFCDRESQKVMILTERSQPVGLLNLADLLPYLGTFSSRFPQQLEPSLNLHQSLSELNFPLIEPIATLPGELSLHQFWSSLQNPSPSPSQPDGTRADRLSKSDYALVDNQGTYLGLLDRTRLLRYLIQHNPHLLFGYSPLPRNLPPAPNWGLSLPHAWQELIDCLPIPMLLASDRGQILAGNAAWRNSVKLFPYLDTAKADAVNFLAKIPALQHPSTETSATPFQVEQWQFVKMPLPDTLMNLELNAGLQTLADATSTLVAESYKLLTHLKATQPLADAPLSVETLPPPPKTQLWLVMATQLTTLQNSVQALSVKNAELAALNRQKEEFLAAISHELKTPLTALLGLSNLLSSDRHQPLNSRQAQYAQLIHQSGRQMMTIVNDLVDLSRLETGQMELLPERVDIRAVCDRAIHQLQQALEYSQAEKRSLTDQLDVEIAPNLIPPFADELRLRQMLMNLLTNAVRLTQPSDRIGLRVAPIGSWVEFTVWDSGAGIRVSEQVQLLKRFQRLESPFDPQLTSTGLELILSQQLAQLHGGDLSFISQEDRGSQFSLLLPQPAQEQPLADASSAKFALLVEINPQRIQTLSAALQELGYWCLVARSDAEAIEKARRFQPQAILLNLTYAQPYITAELLEQLKNDPQTCNLRTLILGQVTEPLRLTLVDDFLSFPIEPQALVQKLRPSLPTSPMPSPQKSSPHLTILYLSPVDPDFDAKSDRALKKSELDEALTGDFSAIPHGDRRIVEVDDLDQAELLTRIWKPNVLLLNDAGLADPLDYLQQLSQHPALASLPIVTLTQETTQAANQVSDLSVFPCLISPDSQSISSTLLQVMQVAAEFAQSERR